jgi:hypothetical protein
LYKEDFEGFSEILNEMTDYIVNEKGEEVISDRHQKDFKKEYQEVEVESENDPSPEKFTDINFEDI